MLEVTEGKCKIYVPGLNQQVAPPKHHTMMDLTWPRCELEVRGNVAHTCSNEPPWEEWNTRVLYVKVENKGDISIFSPPSLTSESRNRVAVRCWVTDNESSEAMGADENGLILRVMHVNVTGTARLPTGALWDYLSQNICILPSENGWSRIAEH